MHAITHYGKAIGTDGLITDVEGTPLKADDADAYNKAVEAQQIEWLKTAPDKVTLYVKHEGWQGVKPNKLWSHSGYITTWPGTILCHAWIGSEVSGGLYGNAKKASVDCLIFGVRYVGWYYCSSGDYCILRKAKRQ